MNDIMLVLLPLIVLGIFVLMSQHHKKLPMTQRLGWGLISLGLLGEFVLRIDPGSGLLWMCVLKDFGVMVLVSRVLFLMAIGRTCYKGGMKPTPLSNMKN